MKKFFRAGVVLLVVLGFLNDKQRYFATTEPSPRGVTCDFLKDPVVIWVDINIESHRFTPCL